MYLLSASLNCLLAGGGGGEQEIFVCFIHHCIPSSYNNILSIAETQKCLLTNKYYESFLVFPIVSFIQCIHFICLREKVQPCKV